MGTERQTTTSSGSRIAGVAESGTRTRHGRRRCGQQGRRGARRARPYWSRSAPPPPHFNHEPLVLLTPALIALSNGLAQLPGGSEHAVAVDLSGAETMQQLQSYVLEQWAQLGGSRKDGLRMQYVVDGGEECKVTKSTTIEMLRTASTLRLQAKQQPRACAGAGKPEPNGARRGRPPIEL